MSGPLWLILQQIERRLVETLLRSPAFHRGVQRVHKSVQEMRHGRAPEDMGGTAIDDPNRRSLKHFFQFFWEELKTGHKPPPKTKK